MRNRARSARLEPGSRDGGPAARVDSSQSPEDSTKFLDLERWLQWNLHRAAALGLIGAPGLKILDLGCGTGQFLFVCQALGHESLGVDLPIHLMGRPDRQIYADMAAAFGIRVERTAIRAHQSLDVPGKFDLITAFRVVFNRHKREDEWTRKE